MAAEQHKVTSAEDPAVRGIEAHTSEIHRAYPPETPHGAGTRVAAPFREAESLPAPSLEKER